jgi:serine/threonine-protein kinase
MSTCQHCGRQHPDGTSSCPRTGDALAAPGLIGARLDRYHVEALLGAGGFGAVYRARHVHTDAAVALKVLKPALGADAQMVERFLREAKAAAAVGNEHIVRVLDAGHDAKGTPFLALELLEGMDLQELAQREGPLAPGRIVELALQVLEGLEAAHRKGIVHRDMKPANVFVTRRADGAGGEHDFVKLLDFGISKMHREGDPTAGLTMTGVAMGTPSYMAPEQFFDARSVDARADVYSVAAMVYELLSGRLPFEATSFPELIVKVRTETPRPLLELAPTVPPALAEAVMLGLSREPTQRWPSAGDFARALRAAVPDGSPALAPTARPQPIAPSPSPGDTPSMLLGATATPQPTPRAAPLAPGPASPPVVPAPVTPAPPARRSSNKTLWILGGLGAVTVSCCGFFVVAALVLPLLPGLNDDVEKKDPVVEPPPAPPAITSTAVPDDELPPLVTVPKPGPGAPDIRKTDPQGTQLYDALTFKKTGEPPDDARAAYEQLLESKGVRRGTPEFARKMKRFERVQMLLRKQEDGELTPRDILELRQLGDDE